MNLVYAQIIEIFVEDGMRMGRIRAGGAVKKVSAGVADERGVR